MNPLESSAVYPISSATNRIDERFRQLRKAGRKALVLYLMAGDPDLRTTQRMAPLLEEAGADILELGFPFSDPVADGVVIQAAGLRAAPHMRHMEDFFALSASLRQCCSIPLVLMSYYNPIFRYGEAALLAEAARVGVDGIIVPDLPVVESATWSALARKASVAAIPLEAPNTPLSLLPLIASQAHGFIYMISLKGVTGSAHGLGENLAQRVQQLRAHTTVPLVTGFGISTAEQARALGRLCDGVIVGSSVVAHIAQGGRDMETRVAGYVRSLREALDARD